MTQEGEDVQKQPISTDSFGGASGGTGGSVKGKIPSDQALFSDRRYIRVATNAYNYGNATWCK